MDGRCRERKRDAPWDRELKLVPGLVREARGGLELKVTRSGDGAGVDDRQLRCEFGLVRNAE